MQLFEYIDMLNQPYDIFYTDSVDSQLHCHYYSEVLYITKSSVTVTCNNKKAVLEEGDLCYIYPLQLHAVSKADDNPAEYAVLKFDVHTINIPQAYLSKFYDIFIRRSREEDFCIILKDIFIDRTKMNSLIQHIVNEFQEENEFYALHIQADIYTLLIEIARKIKRKISLRTKNVQILTFHFITFWNISTHIRENSLRSRSLPICAT